jgi:predicted O-methyltransferase YrrM
MGDFYSPVPDVKALPAAHWERRSDLAGLRFDSAAQLAYLERELAGFISEFNPPREARSADEFHLDNGTYGSVDAEVLYAMLRRHRPRRVIELGSGASSLVTAAALRRNRDDGRDSTYTAFDPFPRSDLASALRDATDLRLVSATDVPLGEFRALGEDDVLFVDTTHTVKAGGDVNRIVLEVLPALAPGVVVHFHDVFLPWEYPREWLEEEGYYWAEQYLLQAFLAFNRDFEVLFASHLVSRDRPDDLARAVPSFTPGRNRPSALWLRRVSS